MKNSKKHAVNSSFPLKSGGSVHAQDGIVVEHSDKALELFTGIHNSKQFTFETAHRLFAGVKRSR